MSCKYFRPRRAWSDHCTAVHKPCACQGEEVFCNYRSYEPEESDEQYMEAWADGEGYQPLPPKE